MTSIEEKVYEEIAFAYMAFLKKEKYDFSKLKGYLLVLNGMHISRDITDFTYEYLTDFIGLVLANN